MNSNSFSDDFLTQNECNAIREHLRIPDELPVSTSEKRHECVITVENASGEDLDVFDVVTLTVPIFERTGENFQLKAFQFGVEMQCTKPTNNSTNCTAILLDAIPAGKFGKALVSGAVACQIDSGSESSASEQVTYAKPTPNATHLTIHSFVLENQSAIVALAASLIGNAPGELLCYESVFSQSSMYFLNQSFNRS